MAYGDEIIGSGYFNSNNSSDNTYFIIVPYFSLSPFICIDVSGSEETPDRDGHRSDVHGSAEAEQEDGRVRKQDPEGAGQDSLRSLHQSWLVSVIIQPG